MAVDTVSTVQRPVLCPLADMVWQGELAGLLATVDGLSAEDVADLPHWYEVSLSLFD